MIARKNNHSAQSNPFRPGMGLNPPYLADREAQLIRFDHYLAGFPAFPRNVRVTGLRGVGETVLFQHYATLAEEHGWIVVCRECTEHLQDESTLALTLVEDCCRAVEHSSRIITLRHRSAAAVRQLLDLLGGLTVSLEGVTLAVKPAGSMARRPAILEDQLFQALELACEGARGAGRQGVVLCYDEAQVLRDNAREHQHALGLLLAAVARAQRDGVPIMLVACGLPNLTENLARARSYSERMFQSERLDALRPPEDVLAFTRPITANGREADDQVIAAVRRDTAGYPFHTQFVGALLWEATWPARLITGSDFTAHRDTIMAALDEAFFDARLARTSDLERRVLRAVSLDGERSAVSAVVDRCRLPNYRLQPMIKKLELKGLLYRPERGLIAFTVPLFGEYLRRRQHG